MERLVISNFKLGWISEDQWAKTDFDPAAASNCRDVEFTPRGTVTIRGGTKVLTQGASALATSFIRIYQWQNSDQSDYTLGFTCTSGTTAASAYTITTSGGGQAVLTPINVGTDAWSPSVSGWVSCCSYAGSAIFTFSDTHVLSGRATDLSDSAALSAHVFNSPMGAKVVESCTNYLFFGNVISMDDNVTRSGSRVYFNSNNSITTWPASYYIDLDRDDGDSITAMKTFQDKLVVFKNNKMFLIYWVGGKLLWNYQRITTSIGCVGANAVVEFNGVLYWMHNTGIYSFDGNGAPKEISSQIKPVVTGLSPLVLSQTQAMARSDRGQIWFALPYQGDEVVYSYRNCSVIVYDIELQNWTKFGFPAAALGKVRLGSNYTYADFPLSYSEYSTNPIGAYGSNAAETILYGTYDGKLHEFSTIYTTDDGTAIAAYWISPWIDFGNPDINKRMTRVTAWIQKDRDNVANFTTYGDWDPQTIVHNETFALTGINGQVDENRADFTHYARAFKFMLSADTASASQWNLHKIVTQYFNKGRTKV
jgi:hypothetical protein